MALRTPCQCGRAVFNPPCPGCRAERTRSRGSAAARGYDAAWRRLSARVIAEEGRCVDCGTSGDATNPLTADHVVPLSRGGGRLDRDNLVCRCRRHNSSKGAR